MPLYFNAAVDGSWATLGNWWQDSGYTIAAAALPSATDDVVLDCEVTALGAARTVANASAPGSFSPTDFALTVTGVFTFVSGAGANYGTVIGNCVFDAGQNFGTINGNCVFVGSYSWNASTGIINGNCTFNSGSYNEGTITGNCVFDGAGQDGPSRNKFNGIITGNCTFNGVSGVYANFNNGTIIGDCVFNNGEQNGLVTGDCVFNGTGSNWNLITGDCVFNDNSYNMGTITGNARYSQSAAAATIANLRTGTATGTVTVFADILGAGLL